VVPEFSELNAANTVNGIPGTNVKRVQTTVELREGQTFAIGGLLSRQTLGEVSRIPLFGDIPLIGPAIFHGRKASEVETELIVLVSPEIVRPMEPDEVPPLPGFNHTHPSDHELWKYSRTEGSPDNNVYQTPPFGTGSLHGVPQGYSLFNPEASHGGYGAGMGSSQVVTGPAMGSTMSGGTYSYGNPAPVYGAPMQSYGLQPQPDYSIPPANSYPSSSVPQVPPANFGAPQGAPPTSLPPIPQNYGAPVYPPQSSLPAPAETQKPSMMSRVTSVFRRDQPKPATNVQPAGWSRPAGN
jgi:pilus assembly protein CpaC